MTEETMNSDYMIRPWGAFHRYMSGAMQVSVASGGTVAELRERLQEQLPDGEARRLLARSALATDERLLRESDPLPAAAEISVLPPVVGG